MTREEAIKVLSHIRHNAETRQFVIEGNFHCKSYAREEVEMYDMAISALREQEERSKVVSNADRIRAMSDEELAELLVNGKHTFRCADCDAYVCDDECEKNCLKWLQHPVKEDA